MSKNLDEWTNEVLNEGLWIRPCCVDAKTEQTAGRDSSMSYIEKLYQSLFRLGPVFPSSQPFRIMGTCALSTASGLVLPVIWSLFEVASLK